MSNKNGLPLIGSATEKTQNAAQSQPIIILRLTQAEYDAIAVKDANTLYVIVG